MPSKKEQKQAEDLKAVLDKIDSFPEPYDKIGKRLHETIMETAPDLKPRLWYGAPGYAIDGPVLIFFRVDDYMSFGLTEKVPFRIEVDASHQLMECAWFLTSIDDATESKIADIVRKALN